MRTFASVLCSLVGYWRIFVSFACFFLFSCVASFAYAERIEHQVSFTLGVADNRFYTDKIVASLLQDAIAVSFVRSLDERTITNLAFAGVSPNALNAVAFCLARVKNDLFYTPKRVDGTGIWEYNEVRTLHHIASLARRDDILYLLQQIYAQHKQQMQDLLQLHARTLNPPQAQAEAIVLQYQNKAKQFIAQQMLYSACRFIDLNMNDAQMRTEAQAAWRTLHDAQPHWAVARYFLARILFAEKRVTEALALMKPLIQERTSSIYLLLYGDLLVASGDTDGALVVWQQALQQSPSFYAVDTALAQRFTQYNQPKQQTIALQKVVAMRPSDYQALFALAQLSKKTNDKLFVSYLEQTIAARPDYLPAYDQLIGWYQTYDQLDAALTLATTAMNIAPEDANRLIIIGEIYAHKGQLQQALFYYQQALTLGLSETAKKRLQSLLTQ